MRDSILGGTRLLVRILVFLNIAAGIGFALGILATFWVNGPLLLQLANKYGGKADDIVVALQVMLATGLLSVAVAYFFLRALEQILASVAAGDPFIVENGRRLQRMGFAMLAFQVGDILVGLIQHWLAGLGADTAPWFPSLGGWLAVLLLFVLARVFAVGATMRDELEGTV
jgi:hypothetical protein